MVIADMVAPHRSVHPAAALVKRGKDGVHGVLHISRRSGLGEHEARVEFGSNGLGQGRPRVELVIVGKGQRKETVHVAADRELFVLGEEDAGARVAWPGLILKDRMAQPIVRRVGRIVVAWRRGTGRRLGRPREGNMVVGPEADAHQNKTQQSRLSVLLGCTAVLATYESLERGTRLDDVIVAGVPHDEGSSRVRKVEEQIRLDKRERQNHRSRKVCFLETGTWDAFVEGWLSQVAAGAVGKVLSVDRGCL